MKLTLWQEVDLIVGSQSFDSRTILADGEPTVRLTAWEHNLTTGGQTWTPARIGHGNLKQTLSLLGDECDVSIFAAETVNPLRPYAGGEAEKRLVIPVAEVRVNAAGAVVLSADLFTGDVRSVEHADDRIAATAAAFGDVVS